MEQRSPEWFAARLGKATASRIVDVVARTKTGWGASRANYMAQLVCERMTGTSQDSYVNGPMQRGIETEPDALIAYSFYSDNEVDPVGFIEHPYISMSGASPDGHIGTVGSLEVKCPNTSTHIETLLNGKVSEKYMIQVQWQLACSEREWCDFVSYDPRMPEELKLFVRRVKRNDEDIEALEQAVRQFLSEVDAKVEKLMSLTLQEAA